MSTLEVIDSYLSLDSTQYAQAPIGATRLATEGNGTNLYGTIPTWSATNWEIEFDVAFTTSTLLRVLIDSDDADGRYNLVVNGSTNRFQVSAVGHTIYLDGNVIDLATQTIPTDKAVHHIKMVGTGLAVKVATVLTKYDQTFFYNDSLFNLRLTDLGTPANSRFYPMDEDSSTSTFIDTSANAANGTWFNRTSANVKTVYPDAIKPGQEFWVACKFRINSTSLSKFLGSIGTFLTGASSIVFRTDASGYLMVSRYNGTTAINHTISTVIPEIGAEYVFVFKKNADNSIDLYVGSLSSHGHFASGTGLTYALDWLGLNGAKTTIGASSLRTDVDFHYFYLYSGSPITADIEALMAGEHPYYVGDVRQGYNLAGDGDEVNGGPLLTLFNSPNFVLPKLQRLISAPVSRVIASKQIVSRQIVSRQIVSR